MIREERDNGAELELYQKGKNITIMFGAETN